MKKYYIISLFFSFIILEASDYEVYIMDAEGNKRNGLQQTKDMSIYNSDKISRKSAGVNISVECNKTILLNQQDKSILINSAKLGPLPLTLKVEDKDGKELFNETNKEHLISNFKIPTNVIEEDSSIIITNAFDDQLVCNKVKKK